MVGLELDSKVVRKLLRRPLLALAAGNDAHWGDVMRTRHFIFSIA